MDLQDAHPGIQVADLDRACALLAELLGPTFAEPVPGGPIRVRVEVADAAVRPACERWAGTGRNAGMAADFELGDRTGARA